MKYIVLHEKTNQVAYVGNKPDTQDVDEGKEAIISAAKDKYNKEHNMKCAPDEFFIYIPLYYTSEE